jgi:chromosome segregation ATPase
MAAKKRGPQPDLNKLTRIIERGFASVASDLETANEKIGDLKTEMMEQFEHVDKQFGAADDRLREISSELAAIHRRLERLEEQGASTAGFAREIDHALERIAAIEKHLGLNKKIAA